MTIVKKSEAALTSWSPFRDLERAFSGSLTDLFDLTSYRPLWSTALDEAVWNPSIDVLDKGDRYLVRAEIPGLKKDEIEVCVSEGTLTIGGERKEDKETKEDEYVHREYYYGRFYRTLTLPSGTDSSKIEATYTDGILELTVPKTAQAETKKIEVKSTKPAKASK